MTGVASQAQTTLTKQLFILDVVATCFVGLGAIMSAISHICSDAWLAPSPVNHEELLQLFQDKVSSTRTFSLLGIALSMVGFVLNVARLAWPKTVDRKKTRTTFLALIFFSFTFLLIAVGLWGDFAKHIKDESDEVGQSIVAPRHEYGSQPIAHVTAGRHLQVRLGWAYWLMTCADVGLFIAFILLLIRKDCDKQARSSLDDQWDVVGTHNVFATVDGPFFTPYDVTYSNGFSAGYQS